MKKVVGVLVHERFAPELVVREIPEGRRIPADLVVLPGIEAPDTDELGGDGNIGYDLAGRLVGVCAAVRRLKDSNSVMCEHLGFAHAVLRDLMRLVGSSAAYTVSVESVEALIRTAIDRVQRVGKALGVKFEFEEAE